LQGRSFNLQKLFKAFFYFFLHYVFKAKIKQNKFRLTENLRTPTDGMGRHTGNNRISLDILHNNGAGGDNRPASYCNAAGDANMGANPYIVAYDNGSHNMIQTCHRTIQLGEIVS
jgi:hypothetical protein